MLDSTDWGRDGIEPSNSDDLAPRRFPSIWDNRFLAFASNISARRLRESSLLLFEPESDTFPGSSSGLAGRGGAGLFFNTVDRDSNSATLIGPELVSSFTLRLLFSDNPRSVSTANFGVGSEGAVSFGMASVVDFAGTAAGDGSGPDTMALV